MGESRSPYDVSGGTRLRPGSGSAYDLSDRRSELFECPHCQKMVGIEHFACQSGAKGGSAGTGEVKARSREQCQKAALIRWHKRQG